MQFVKRLYEFVNRMTYPAFSNAVMHKKKPQQMRPPYNSSGLFIIA